MAALVQKHTVLQTNFDKCGEITCAVQVGKRIYALNCLFCTTICLQLEAFVLHLEQQHNGELSDINAEYTKQEEEQQEAELEAHHRNYLELRQLVTEKVAEIANIKHDTDESTQYVDPLLEAPMSVRAAQKEPPPMCVIHVKQETDGTEHNLDALQQTKEEEEEPFNETIEESCEDEHAVDALMQSSDTETEMETESDNDDDDDENADDDEAADESDDVEDKQLMLALIAGYAAHPILWDPSNAHAKNRKKRDDALKKISQTLKKKLSVTLSPKAIGERIKKLRYKYRSELQLEKLAETKNETFTHCWYFEKLTFLNKGIKYKPRNKRGAKALANEKPALPLPNMTHAQNIELIETYKSYPCLWDMQHIGFRFKAQRTDALNEMLQALKNKMQLVVTPEELQKKLYRIRYACTQEKHRQLQCERTQKTFVAASKYFEQIAFLVDNVGPFKCEFCAETFNGADQYRIHKSKHDGSMPFVCPICNRGFMKVGNCTVHLRRHTRDYPFECKVCGKRYATTTDINVHMRYHTGEKPYFCEICGQSFRTWSFFDAHMRRHQKRPGHVCTLCNKAFYENNKLTEHMKAHLNVRDKVCNICGKAFTSSKYLRQHKQIHAEKKKYQCKICGKDFAQYAGLSGHMKSHGTTISGGAGVDDNH